MEFPPNLLADIVSYTELAEELEPLEEDIDFTNALDYVQNSQLGFVAYTQPLARAIFLGQRTLNTKFAELRRLEIQEGYRGQLGSTGAPVTAKQLKTRSELRLLLRTLQKEVAVNAAKLDALLTRRLSRRLEVDLPLELRQWVYRHLLPTPNPIFCLSDIPAQAPLNKMKPITMCAQTWYFPISSHIPRLDSTFIPYNAVPATTTKDSTHKHFKAAPDHLRLSTEFAAEMAKTFYNDAQVVLPHHEKIKAIGTDPWHLGVQPARFMRDVNLRVAVKEADFTTTMGTLSVNIEGLGHWASRYTSVSGATATLVFTLRYESGDGGNAYVPSDEFAHDAKAALFELISAAQIAKALALKVTVREGSGGTSQDSVPRWLQYDKEERFEH
jgi:hypothetical protein